eukprot:548483-Alexandrium_andersonii.AAC.1
MIAHGARWHLWFVSIKRWNTNCCRLICYRAAPVRYQSDPQPLRPQLQALESSPDTAKPPSNGPSVGRP